MKNKTKELFNHHFDAVYIDSRSGTHVWDCYLSAKAAASEGLLDGFDIYIIHNRVNIPIRISGHIVEYNTMQLYELIRQYNIAKNDNLFVDPLWRFAVDQSINAKDVITKNLGKN
jgi:hypothetical protein